MWFCSVWAVLLVVLHDGVLDYDRRFSRGLRGFLLPPSLSRFPGAWQRYFLFGRMDSLGAGLDGHPMFFLSFLPCGRPYGVLDGLPSGHDHACTVLSRTAIPAMAPSAEKTLQRCGGACPLCFWMGRLPAYAIRCLFLYNSFSVLSRGVL
jgi:hypothetical protein